MGYVESKDRVNELLSEYANPNGNGRTRRIDIRDEIIKEMEVSLRVDSYKMLNSVKRVYFHGVLHTLSLRGLTGILEEEDVFNESVIGLIKAIDHYSPESKREGMGFLRDSASGYAYTSCKKNYGGLIKIPLKDRDKIDSIISRSKDEKEIIEKISEKFGIDLVEARQRYNLITIGSISQFSYPDDKKNSIENNISRSIYDNGRKIRDEIEVKEVREIIREAMTKLEPEYIEAIELIDLREKTFKDAGEEIGITGEGVRKRRKKGINNLRKILKKKLTKEEMLDMVA
jgi:RNA polymerase sigma factor (sigma-70 family)